MARERLAAAALALGLAAVLALALAHSAEIRARAQHALGEGMPAREAALARGFVLGDDGVDPLTEDDFRRSGLSHLLAVSGQNVALLALLATPLLAAFGLPLRARLAWLLALIAVYVPLAGAGPSIQRAGVMGALSVLATLAGRRSSRFHALIVAAIVTLAVQPAVAADIGWQLSFAALLGILLMAAPLREAIGVRLGRGSWRTALAEGAAMTVAATIATAPLIAFHFGTLSTTTLAANLLALPAVAPAMWLGMLAAGGGQVPGFPVEALNWANAPLLAYIAQIAAWCGRPSWASLDVRLGPAGLAAAYLGIAMAWLAASRLRRRSRIAAAPGRRRIAAAAIALLLLGLSLPALGQGGDASRPSTSSLRVSFLDVGQGSAILIEPAGGEAILVDTGPASADLLGELGAAGVDRLGAVVLSHDQSDHAGGFERLIAARPVARLLYAVLDRRTLAAARGAGVALRHVAAGSVVRSAEMRLAVLWPPPELLAGARIGEDPNRLSLVMLLRWRDFTMLLSSDAEAEATPLDPGPIDVLEVAHHGSEDAGLAALLAATMPSVAVISAGQGNSYGHPAPSTLATLAEAGVPTWRTDRDGTVVVEADRGSFRVLGGG